MASQNTIKIVKSTVPALKQYGEDITRAFYKMMFKNHPELREVFNMTNQKKGTQPKTLANSVFHYASHIEDLQKLDDKILGPIIHKHVSLSITADMYPIVGKHLLLAIKEVLGDAATDEVINAWAEAYQDFADLLIRLEEDIYKEAESAIGGYRGQQGFIVVKKEKESSLITSFYLKRASGEELPNFLPGQYVSISVKVPGEEHIHTRTYSLSDYNSGDYLRISVKKELTKWRGIVSTYLHESVHVGDVLKLGIPAGDFVIKESQNPVVLIGGGVGVTPLLGMYNYLVNHTKRDVVFIQAVLNSEHHAFKKEINEGVNTNVKYVTVYSDPLKEDVLGVDYDVKGFVDVSVIKPHVTDTTEVYFCGPTPFMSHLLKVVNQLNIKQENINYEVFGPTGELQID